jgi:hypothetical protein
MSGNVIQESPAGGRSTPANTPEAGGAGRESQRSQQHSSGCSEPSGASTVQVNSTTVRSDNDLADKAFETAQQQPRRARKARLAANSGKKQESSPDFSKVEAQKMNLILSVTNTEHGIASIGAILDSSRPFQASRSIAPGAMSQASKLFYLVSATNTVRGLKHIACLLDTEPALQEQLSMATEDLSWLSVRIRKANTEAKLTKIAAMLDRRRRNFWV